MAKTKISEFSSTPGNNTDIDGINIAEGCAPSGINDAIRELMSQLKDFQTGSAGDSFNGPVGTTTAAAGAFTTLSASSTVSGTGFSTYLASPPAIGGTAAAAGSFTTLSASSSVTLSGGTANGVLYLNASKVATSGSALTFDGTTLNNTGASPGIRATLTGGASYASLNADGVYATGTDLYLFAPASKFISFYASGSEQMRLTSTGLGIGTSSPAGKLDIYQNSARYVRAYPSSGLADFEIVTNNNVQPVFAVKGTGTADLIRAYANTTQVLTLDSSGNLGLGVVPSAWSSSFRAMQVNGGFGLMASSSVAYLFGNGYYNTSNNNIYYSSAPAVRLDLGDGFKFFTAASGTAGNTITFTQAMTLDASGNLGIGTSSPSVASGGGMAIYNATAARLALKSNATSSTSGLQIGIDNGGLAFIEQRENNALTFSTNATERARFDSSGNFLVGTTSAMGGGGSDGYNGFGVQGSAGSRFMVIQNLSDANIYLAKNSGYTSSTFTFFYVNGSGVGSITTSGTATAYNTSSDYRLKDNQQPLTGSGAFIDALKPKTWEWKADGSKGVGFIAHEVQEVSPGSVVGEKDAVDEDGKPKYQAMEYGSAEFIANIIAELQSLRQRVAQLEKGN